MPELTGIQFMNLIKGMAKVILTTAYPQYALEGFEYDAIDYLLKPISFERFLKASQKSYNQIIVKSAESNSVQQMVQQGLPQDFIFIKTEHRLQQVKHSEILFIEGGKEYTTIHTKAEKILSLSSLKKITEMLPYPQFMRIHKSYTIPLNKIDSIEFQRVLIGKQYLPLGAMFKDEFIKQIDEA